MITIRDLLNAFEAFAPYSLAESWDNCGLLVGDHTKPVTRVLCALDITETVVQEAMQKQAQLVVSHHPVIFTSVQHITAEDTTGRVLRQLIQNDIGAICMHTNADCAHGGVNDALAHALGLTEVVSMGAGDAALLGRVGNLAEPMQPDAFARFVKKRLSAGGVRFVRGRQEIRRVAVGGGACGKLMDHAQAEGADAFVIGDCSYDIMQRAESIGLTLVDAGHFPTENPVTQVFADFLQKQFPAVEAFCSTLHTDCIHFV